MSMNFLGNGKKKTFPGFVLVKFYLSISNNAFYASLTHVLLANPIITLWGNSSQCHTQSNKI